MYWIIYILSRLHDISSIECRMWIKLAIFWYPKEKSWSVCILCPIFSPSFLRSKHSLLPWYAMQICIHTNACNKMPFPTPATHATWDFNKTRLQSDLKSTKLASWDQQKKHNGCQSRIKVGAFFGLQIVQLGKLLLHTAAVTTTPWIPPGDQAAIWASGNTLASNSCRMHLLVRRCFTAIYLYYLHDTQSTLLYNYTKPIARHSSF